MEFTLRSVAYGSYYRYSIPMLQSSPTGRRITMTKGKHLTLENRIAIASGLNEHMSFKAIALRIGKDCTTVSKEIKLHVSARRESPRCKIYNKLNLAVNFFTPIMHLYTKFFIKHFSYGFVSHSFVNVICSAK